MSKVFLKLEYDVPGLSDLGNGMLVYLYSAINTESRKPLLIWMPRMILSMAAGLFYPWRAAYECAFIVSRHTKEQVTLNVIKPDMFFSWGALFAPRRERKILRMTVGCSIREIE